MHAKAIVAERMSRKPQVGADGERSRGEWPGMAGLEEREGHRKWRRASGEEEHLHGVFKALF